MNSHITKIIVHFHINGSTIAIAVVRQLQSRRIRVDKNNRVACKIFQIGSACHLLTAFALRTSVYPSMRGEYAECVISNHDIA